MFDELEAHVRIGRLAARQLDGDVEHLLTEERHPGGAVSLLQMASGRQRRAAVENADIVEPQKATIEGIVAGAVLAVYPPGEVEHQLVEGTFEPIGISLAAPEPLQTIGEEGGPGMHRRVDVCEVPLVSGKLPAGMQIRVEQHQVELLLAEVLI